MNSLVIQPLKKLVSPEAKTMNALQRARFAYDLATSDLHTLSDTANKELDAFTKWDQGMPPVIEDFSRFCKRQSNLILSDWICSKGDSCLETIFENEIPSGKPVLLKSYTEVFKQIQNHSTEAQKSFANFVKERETLAKQLYDRGNLFETTTSSMNSGDTSLAGNIQRLFTEKVEILPKVEVSKAREGNETSIQLVSDSNTIILILLKYIIKGITELLRLQSRTNLHQTQLDIHRFREFIRQYFPNKGISKDQGLAQLFDDWLNSVMVRSDDISLLSDQALNLIISHS